MPVERPAAAAALCILLAGALFERADAAHPPRQAPCQGKPARCCPALLSCAGTLQYVSNTLDLIKGTALEGADIITVLRSAASRDTPAAVSLFNNAAQSFNHAFYWDCMSAVAESNKLGKPQHQHLLDLIILKFGSVEKFKKEFATAGMSVFGSGWVWLVHTSSGLEVQLAVTFLLCSDFLIFTLM